MLQYMDLTKDQIADLSRDTILISCISPIEVHGPHLPVGTDIFIANEVMKRLARSRPDLCFVQLPDLPLGGHPVPVAGSLPVKRKVLQSILFNWGKKLSDMGFNYWVVIDNHGGFTHQLAFCEASRKLIRHGFYLVNPFLHILQDMNNDNKNIKLPPAQNGNPHDAHAGTNETSLMLAVDPSKIKNFKDLKKYRPQKTSAGNILRKLANEGVAATSEWISDKNHPSYVGDPSKANKESGEIMLNYHVKRSDELLTQALNNSYTPPKLFNPFTEFLFKILPEW